MPSPRPLQLTLGRAAGGLGAGALVGAGLTAVGVAAKLLADAFAGGGAGDAGGVASALAGAAVSGVFAFIFALFVYVAGLATIAAPLWALLHACRARSWPVAILLGAVLNGGVFFLLDAVAALSSLA